MEPNDRDQSNEENLAFRRLPRVGARLDSLDLYGRTMARTGAPFADPARIADTTEVLRRHVTEAAQQESTLHGWRAQSLFEAVVASLAGVRLLTQEDVGDVYFKGPTVRPPDFRVVTDDSGLLLVEVKSFWSKKPLDRLRVRRDYVDELTAYTAMLPTAQLRFAVYWARWNVWTLVPVEAFERDGTRHLSLDLPAAAKANEMGTLGDRTPGTEWPLTFRLVGDSQPTGEPGQYRFVVRKAELAVARRVITDPREEAIAMRLMRYSSWEEAEETVISDSDGASTSIMFTRTPIEPDAQDTFALHPPLSSLFSSMFIDATTTESGEVADLRVDIEPGSLRDLIPDQCEGDVLKIWRFRLSPST